MRGPKRHACLAVALMVPGLMLGLGSLAMPLGAQACELVLREHRSGQNLIRLPLNPNRPAADVAFTHSVLGTPVLDRYVWRHSSKGWRAHLVEERFEGEGYGLPSAAAPGEQLVRDGPGWRLLLDRVIDPLVVLPLPAQRMRLVLPDERELLLGDLSRQSIEMRAENCPLPR